MRIKKVKIVILILLSHFTLVAQTDHLAIEKKILSNCIKYNDAQSAIQQLLRIITLQPGAIAYKDTLANLYFSTSNYIQCIQVANELKDSAAYTTTANLLMARSYAALGAHKEAINTYEVCLKSQQKKSPIIVYELVKSQIQLGRNNEAIDLLQPIANDTTLINIRVDEILSNKKIYTTNLNAAAYNTLGVIYAAQKKYDIAVAMFIKSINADANYSNPKENIEIIKNSLVGNTGSNASVKDPKKRSKKN